MKPVIMDLMPLSLVTRRSIPFLLNIEGFSVDIMWNDHPLSYSRLVSIDLLKTSTADAIRSPTPIIEETRAITNRTTKHVFFLMCSAREKMYQKSHLSQLKTDFYFLTCVVVDMDPDHSCSRNEGQNWDCKCWANQSITSATPTRVTCI